MCNRKLYRHFPMKSILTDQNFLDLLSESQYCFPGCGWHHRKACGELNTINCKQCLNLVTTLLLANVYFWYTFDFFNVYSTSRTVTWVWHTQLLNQDCSQYFCTGMKHSTCGLQDCTNQQQPSYVICNTILLLLYKPCSTGMAASYSPLYTSVKQFQRHWNISPAYYN